jgi:hypothetical protein
MILSPIRRTLAGAALAAVLAAPAAAQDFTRIEGFLVDSGGVIPRFSSGTLDVRIDELTPDSELAAFARVAKKDGDIALLNRLSGEDYGKLRVSQGLGRPLAIAQQTREDGMIRILAVVLRDMSAQEVFRGSLTTDYPYLVIDALVDRDGVGEGELYPLARLRISPDGKLTYQSLVGVPMRILQIEAS